MKSCVLIVAVYIALFSVVCLITLNPSRKSFVVVE